MKLQEANLLNSNIPVREDRVRRTAPSLGQAAEVAGALPFQTNTQTPTSGQLDQAIKHINLVLQQANRNLEFSLDEETKRVIVKIVDTETGDVIRQIPSEETLAIARVISDFQKGLLLRQTA